MRNDLNDIFNNYLTKYNQYDTYVDGFYGMGGSFKALSDSLQKHGVKTVIVNEINTCIITMHENIRNSPIKMRDYFLEFVRTEIIIPYKKLYIPIEEFLKVKQKMIQRFNELQKKKEFGIETSTLLIMLSAFNFSGMMSFKKGGIISFGKPIYEFDDIDDFFYKTIKRIDTYSELYNRFDMKFFNSDYFILHKEFKNRKNTLWNIDPVYFKANYSEYNTEEMMNLKNSDIPACVVNYAQKDFNHIGVLETLKDIDFIYNNNTSPILYHYINKLDLEYRPFDRKEVITSTKNAKVKNVVELILYKNNFKQPLNNIFDSKSLEKCA
jgi:hypothetical protein